jgi:flavin reductase (DIM6/NTAB) family NADH-FMN oxidoreductase RutF
MFKDVAKDFYYLLHPKLAFFLTSIDRKGRANVMTCAWATPVSEEPPMVVVCVSRGAHTAKLIRSTREFVINIPTRDLLRQLWFCGGISGRDTDKFSRAELTPQPASLVKPPRVQGCIGYLECRVCRTVPAGECYAFFGEVLAASAEGKYFSDGMWKPEAQIPCHLAGKRMVFLR